MVLVFKMKDGFLDKVGIEIFLKKLCGTELSLMLLHLYFSYSDKSKYLL